jgi:hypothetical protein
MAGPIFLCQWFRNVHQFHDARQVAQLPFGQFSMQQSYTTGTAMS